MSELKIGERRKAVVDFSDIGIGTFRERGVLERKDDHYVLHREDGNRVFPMNGRSVEVYLVDSDIEYFETDEPSFVVADPRDYGSEQ